MHSIRKIVSFGAFGLVLASSLLAAPAQAVEVASPLDAASNVERLAPGIVQSPDETSNDARSDVATPDISVDADEANIALQADAQPTVTVGIEGMSDASRTESGAFTVLHNGDRTAYVQAIAGGSRLLSYIPDASGALSTIYTFDFDAPITAAANDDGSYSFTDTTTGVGIGMVSTPWAVDADGTSLPTHYSWADGKLTQTIDADPQTIAYPVLADPAWTYNMTFTIGRSNATKVWKELHRCFNCNFAVTGAPKAFPKVGQTLPLTFHGFGSASVRLKEAYNYTNPNVRPGINSGFIFVANKGHIDGAGSVINFDFLTRNTDKQLIMTVSANIKNGYGGKAGQNAYRQFALGQWSQFAGRLQRNLGLQVQPGPAPTPPGK